MTVSNGLRAGANTAERDCALRFRTSRFPFAAARTDAGEALVLGRGQFDGCPQEAQAQAELREPGDSLPTAERLSENRETALQTTRQVLPLRVILPKTVSVRCGVRTAKIGDQLGENRDLPPEQAIFGQARTERQTASTPIRLAEAAAIGLEQSGTNQPMVVRLYWQAVRGQRA